jgi:hypothetical protein
MTGPSQDDRDLLLDTLTLLASYDSGQPTRAFRTPSRETTQNELSEIAKRASDLLTRLRYPKCSVTRAREQLAQRLEDMHETTIFALSHLNIAFVRLGLPGLLRDNSTDRERLANELAPLMQTAATAEAPDTSDEGPWPDRRVQAVAGLLVASSMSMCSPACSATRRNGARGSRSCACCSACRSMTPTSRCSVNALDATNHAVEQHWRGRPQEQHTIVSGNARDIARHHGDVLCLHHRIMVAGVAV